jgi:enediyne biosynthesis protein E4
VQRWSVPTALALVVSCGDPAATVCSDPPRAAPVAWFADVTPDSGMDVHYATTGFKGGGLAVGDLDGDGRPDVVASPRTSGLAAYQNVGGLRFAPRPDWGLPGDLGATAIAIVDLDNDGDRDLVLANTDLLAIFANDGTGRLTEVQRYVGEGSTEHVLAVDLDGDGLLDLFASNYDLGGGRATANRVYMNRGDLVFDVATVDGEALSWTASLLDIDDDGDLDLYVANDTLVADHGEPPARPPFWPPDQFLRNDGAGPDGRPRFTDIAAALGLATPRSSMGGLVRDWNDDGLLDLFIPDFGPSKLFLRQPDGRFADAAAELGLATSPRRNSFCGADSRSEACLTLSWSAAASDFDGDGRDELLVVNGATGPGDVPPVLLFTPTGTHYAERAPAMACTDARALVVTDLDGDGDQDVLVAPVDGALIVYETRGRPKRSLEVTLRGRQSNRDGIGAIVTAHLVSGITRTRIVGSGGGVHSNGPAEAWFGLGEETMSSLVVRWPSGTVDQRVGPLTGRLVLDEP